jgi:acyl-CoA reductase-like NAD-dependent aldehyde dehydrogenase
VCTREDLDLAVSAARSAFKLWSKTPIQERRAALHAYADAVAAQHDFFTRLLTQEQGKPLAQAGVEIDMAVAWLKEIPAVALPETVLREDDQQKIIQRYVPMGVAAGIVPWNFPVLLAVGKIASAIYTGNAIIVKPSPFTPYCTLKLGELATKIFPPGLLQVLSGDENLGPWITAHAGINKISFTGSIETGKRVMASSATTLKRVTLELGGNDPAIICENVDISDVVPKV